jgi:predicted exporter
MAIAGIAILYALFNRENLTPEKIKILFITIIVCGIATMVGLAVLSGVDTALP